MSKTAASSLRYRVWPLRCSVSRSYLVYLPLFPFQPWGMALLIGASAIILALVGRSGDIITAGITTAVAMVVAAIDPHAAEILCVIDTAVGIAVGTPAGIFNLGITRSRR